MVLIGVLKLQSSMNHTSVHSTGLTYSPFGNGSSVYQTIDWLELFIELDCEDRIIMYDAY